MNLTRPFETIINGQYRCPTGLIGRFIGAKMVQQHQPETLWTISLLDTQPHDHVLEVGFGAGKAIEQLATLATSGHIAGIDLSPTMLRTAQRRNAQAIRAGRVELQHGDVTRLPFADQQFDKLISIHTIYFWPHLDRALAEIFRVLKPGASLALAFSPGKVGEETNADAQKQLEQCTLPTMQHLGFTHIDIKEGPASRQFRSIAIVGVK